MAPYVGLLNRPARPPGGNRTGSAVGGACTNPVPSGVVKSAPRVTRKPSNGFPATAVVWLLPPPSQLISRRPLGSGPRALPLFGAPSAARYASTELCIEAAVGPAAWDTIGSTTAFGEFSCACAT